MQRVKEFFKKLMGANISERYLNEIEPVVDRINQLESEVEPLTDEELQKKGDEFKKRVDNGEDPDDMLPEVFAVIREVSKRTVDMRHYDVQLMGAIALHEGKIAEMKTGEGKTVAATMPLYLNALKGRNTHLVTVNDYLAQRDAEWMGNIYEFLGMSVGSIVPDQPKSEKKKAYEADIVYGTNNEIGFDYLRDNMAKSPDDIVQNSLDYAILDEVDSILIDEARTPLIISAPDEQSTEMYQKFARIAPSLKRGEDYTVDEKKMAVSITDSGIDKVEEMLGIEDIYESGNVMMAHHIEQALKADALYEKDEEYVVKDGQVVIVDEFTGRLMPGRRYSEGLHQAIEAKEGVEIQRESKTLATITFQNFFRIYDKLAGMTGTAKTEEEEFFQIYGMEVIEIPTNEPVIRDDMDDLVYPTEDAKFKAIVEDIKRRHEKGQPILVGTVDVEKSERLSEMLKKEGIPHEVLNAKNHEREAEIVAKAGEQGSVTIATNMAGRGTDIKLGEGVRERGGLHVLGTERHEARRIDNQLRGRSGRQGDPGSSQFFVSLEDDLMRLFGSEKLQGLMEGAGVSENQPLEHPWISNSIKSAQEKVEGHNFDIRKRVLEYDDVLDDHRDVIYSLRRDILNQESLRDKVMEYIRDELSNLVQFHTAAEYRDDWEFEEMFNSLEGIFALTDSEKQAIKDAGDPQDMTDKVIEIAEKKYEAREEELGEEVMRELERAVVLRVIDMLWMEHIDAMMRLRESIGLRGYGQKDPLAEYKQEAFGMFERLKAAIRSDVTNLIYKAKVVRDAPSQQTQPGEAIMNKPSPDPGFSDEKQDLKQAGKREWPEDVDPNDVGRNEKCPCGSGKKFKKCHWHDFN